MKFSLNIGKFVASILIITALINNDYRLAMWAIVALLVDTRLTFGKR